MNRLIRLACALMFAVVAAAAPPRALAQACSITVDPVIEFGTLLDLPTPPIAVTAHIEVDCGLDSRRVCVGIGAGSGFGSTENDRRMSMTTAVLNTIGYALFKDAAFTQPFGTDSDDRAALVFDGSVGQVQTITIYGRLTPGQFAKPVGDYLSTLVVDAVSHNANKPNCNGNGFLEDVATFQAHVRIGPTCTIVAAPMDFGTVGQLTGSSATTNIGVTCTVDAPYSISLNGGLSENVAARMMQRTPGPGTIAYELYRDPAHTQIWADTSGTMVEGTGTGEPQSIPVYGYVRAQPEPPAGSYRDTITATVTY